MPATDDFATYLPDLDAPYPNAAAVVPADAVDLSDVTRAVYVGGAGNLLCTIGGVDVTFSAVPVGTVLRIRTSRIKATGTTASLMVALW